MKIAIYNEPYGASVGGSEFCAAVLASGLRRAGHDCTLFHHHLGLDQRGIMQAFAIDLAGVTLRYAEPSMPPRRFTRDLPRRYEEAAQWGKEFSAGYDAFVVFTHQTPPFSHAANGILISLFPWTRLREEIAAGDSALPAPFRPVDRAYARWELNRRMASYRHQVAISNFTRVWTDRWWGTSCSVIHPPVSVDFQERPKRNAIITVGRFAVSGHSKKQKEMACTFVEMSAREPATAGWVLQCVGNVAEAGPDRCYFEEVRRTAGEAAVELLPNASRPALKRCLEEAKIYWHAAGFDRDENLEPEMMEHFGITTVEAMAAGCVPVVVGKGGQPEIVEHGVSGFVWNTLADLRRYTLLLMSDDDLRQRMSVAARRRAEQFSTDIFIRKLQQLL